MSEPSDGFEYAWILMCLEDFDNKTPKKKKRPNVGPLLRLLRSDKPISRDVRKLLADLIDPKKPVGIYAKIKFSKPGHPSTTIRDYELYLHCEAIRLETHSRRIPESEWAKIAEKFNFTEESRLATTQFTTTKEAHRRGKRIYEMVHNLGRELINGHS
jgi:hypothetical protein